MAIKEIYKSGFSYNPTQDQNPVVPAIVDVVQGESQMANPATDVVWDSEMGVAKFFVDFEQPTQTGSTIAGRTEQTSRYPHLMEAEEMWFSGSYYLPTSYADDPEDEVIYQWHVGSVTGSPNFSIRIKNGRFVVYLWIASGFLNQMAFDIGPATREVWHNFVIKLKMHPTDGELTVWKDGKLARCHNPVTGSEWSVPTSPPGGGVTNDYTAYPDLGSIQQTDNGISLLVWNGKTARGTYPNPTKYPKWGFYKPIWGSRYNPDKSVKPEAYDPEDPLYVAPSYRQKTLYIKNVKFETRLEEFTNEEIFQSLDVDGNLPTEIPNWWGDVPVDMFALEVRENPIGWGTAVDITNDSPYPEGTEVELQATPNADTEFYRWSRDGVTLSTNQNYLYTTRAQNDTVLGEFLPKKYSLVVVVMTVGGGTTNIESGEYSEGFPIDLVATPNEGFIFDRWEKGGVVLSTEAEYTHYKTAGNETIGAYFLPDTPPELFTLTVESNPVEGGSTNITSLQHAEGEVIPLEATPNSGYQFVNWTKDGTEIATSAVLNYVSGGQDETVVANFEVIPVYKTLTVQSSGNGTVTDIIDQQILVGSEVPVEATPDEGYVFKNWTVGVLIVSTEASFQYKLLEDTVLVANFERQSFGITMLAPEVPGGEGNIVTLPPFYPGDQINIRPSIAEGYSFVRWWIELSPGTWGTITEADTTFEMPVNDVKLRPEFVRKAYSVTVEYDETRGTVAELTESPYIEGAQVRLKAIPLIGYRFSEWIREGAEISVGTEYNFLMPGENVTVQAIFLPADEIPEEPETRDLYDSCIVFRLVKNLKRVIKPLSLLTSEFFEDYDYVEILEPIGWDGVHLETQRDRENHGFTAQVGVDELTFRCNTGQEFIEASEFEGGSDTDLKLVVTENDKLVSVIQLNFETYSKDVDGVHLSVEESPFDGLFATRKDIKYPFGLDKKLLMYSPAHYKITSWGYFDQALQWSPVNQSWPDYQTYRSHLIYNVLANRDNDEIKTAYQYPASIVTMINHEYNRIETARFDRGGRVNIAVSLGMVSYFRGAIENTGRDQIPLRMLVSLYSVRGSSRQDAEWIIPEQEVPVERYNIDHFDTLGVGPVEDQEPGEVEAVVNVWEKSWDVVVYEGDMLRISVHSEQSFDYVHSLLPNQNVAAYVVKEFVDKDTGETHTLGTPETGGLLEITGDFVGPASVAEAVSLRNLFGEVTTQMLEKGTTPIISEVEEDEIIHIIPGYSLRRGGDENKKFTASFTDLITGAKPLLGLGYNIEIGEDEERLRLDYMGKFYRQDRAIGLIHELSNLHSYEERADIDRTYNEVEVGFSKFSKERETNKRLTAYDTHGKQQYLTPIRKTKNKKELISTFIASAFEIDNMRTKQFEVEAVDSMLGEDDNLFMVTATEKVVQEVRVSDVKWKRGLGKIVSDRGQREPGKINGFQVRVEGILPIGVGEEIGITPMGWGSFTIFRVIRDINYAPVDLEGNQYDTIVRFDELTPDEEFMAKDNVALKLDFEPRVIPESVEPFSLVEGTQSPDTSYNLRYTPKRILYNNYPEINVGLLKKGGDEEITLQNIEGNSRVSTQFKEGVEIVGGDLNKARIDENGNVVLETYGNRGRLHQPYTIHATYNNVSYEFYTRVLLGHKTDMESSYGLIEIRTPFGEVVRGFLDICRFYPGARTMELTLLLHDRRPYVEEEYLATENGTFILTHRGDFIIVEI